jgi:hypothetical protein
MKRIGMVMFIERLRRMFLDQSEQVLEQCQESRITKEASMNEEFDQSRRSKYCRKIGKESDERKTGVA